MPRYEELPVPLRRAMLDYAAWLPDSYALSTRRVYLAAARKALQMHARSLETVSDRGSLFLTLYRADWTERKPRPRRLGRFLEFLAAALPQARIDLLPLREHVLKRVGELTRDARIPSLRTRRNLAFLAASCAAPERSNPRLWPRDCLQVQRHRVELWGEELKLAGFAEALRLWAAWRDRLAHEAPGRSLRRPPKWARCRWLFPDRNGRSMSKPRAHAVLEQALARCLQGPGAAPWPAVAGRLGPLDLTPALVRNAFEPPERWPDVPIVLLTTVDGPVAHVPAQV
jgi:hypothetical protein